MLSAFFFLLTTILIFTILMLMPKCQKRLNGVNWFIATCIIVICIWVFGIAILDIFNIGFNLISLSVINTITSLLGLCYLFMKKGKQSYYVELKDIIIMGILAIITIGIAMLRFGTHIDIFAYAQDDSVRHFFRTKNMIISEQISFNRYFLYLLYAVIIQVLHPFIGINNWYKAFMLGDLLMQFLISAIFWVLIRRYIKNRYTWMVGLLFEILYFFGYPLTNMLCGFEYLGSGILTCSILIWVLEVYESQEISDGLLFVLVMLVNTAVCESYTLFAPAVLLGEVIYFIFLYIKKNQIFSFKAFAMLIVGFIIPGFLCIYYVARSYMNVLFPYIFIGIALIGILFVVCNVGVLKKHKTICGTMWITGIVAAIIFIYNNVLMKIVIQFMRADGSIIRQPYSNFLILLFPLILYIIRVIKNKKNDSAIWIMFATLAFSGWMLYCVYLGEIGSYYFYKMHFLMWLLLFFCAFKEVSMTEQAVKKYMTTYLVIIFVGFGLSMTGIEQDWVKHSDWMWPEDASASIYGVYHHNLDMLNAGGNVDADMQAIYSVVREIVNREDTTVLYFGEELKYLKEYFYYLTDQHPSDHRGDLNSDDYPSYDIRGDLEEAGIKYIFVEKDYNGPYEEYKQAFDVMWTEFENDYGWVLKLD